MSKILLKNEKDDAVTLDDLLLFIGEFGYYQRYLFMMLMPFLIFYSFVYFTQVFITITPEEYWCKLPKYNGMSVEALRKIAIPDISKVPYEGHNFNYSRCWIYDVPIDEMVKVTEPNEAWPMKKCDQWDFNYSRLTVPYSTITSEQGWVCDKDYYVTLAQSVFFIGAIFGGLIFGWAADKYGRIPVLIGTGLFGFVGGLGTIFCTRFWEFCLCRFIVGFAFDNLFVIAYIVVLEYVGPKWRTFAANFSYGLFFTMGLMIMPWMAYYMSDWKLFTLVTTVPLISVVLVPWLIPESVRWLITQGKIEKAIKILTYVEKFNKEIVPQIIFEDFIDDCMKTAEWAEDEKPSVMVLFQKPRLRLITILLILSWAIMSMAYDGHIRCLASLGMDVFTTFTVGAATEFPAAILLVFILDFFGRRWSSFGTVILSGLASLGAAAVPIGLTFATFAMIGRFFINIASNIGLQYAAELLPTVVRGEGVAYIHIIGFVSCILSPFVAYTSVFQYNLPMIILGIASIIAAVLCLFLPETLREELPQTILDGELFGIDQRFWDTPWKKKFQAHERDMRSSSHYAHARHPSMSGAVLRSSMVSGYTGNERRVRDLRRNIQHDLVVSKKRKALAEAKSPEDYLRLLREGYRDIKNRNLTDQEDSGGSGTKPQKKKKRRVTLQLNPKD